MLIFELSMCLKYDMDPNFPANLNIHPLFYNPSDLDSDVSSSSQEDIFHQKDAIDHYGIAGRVWEASRALAEYLSPGCQHHDPPCSLLDQGPHRILELGSGQSVASLHLASHLSPEDYLILTDLPNVIPLCQRNIDSWESLMRSSPHCTVKAEPLAWGNVTDDIRSHLPLSHILMCDLIYFPHLYPPLLLTLLELTEKGALVSTETFGPEIILAYHSRTLALEESFFEALGQYFKLTRVTGSRWEAKIFICRRWRVTSDWTLPNLQTVMNGSKEVIRGRTFELIDDMFGALEW